MLGLVVIWKGFGVIIWYAGKALNTGSGKVLIDPETGQQYQMGTQHSLFFVPMQFWGPIGIVIGIILLIASLVIR
ncbi:hypothetical protein LQV63_18045 [Paenibacillus profundus]|uniref:DUF2905 domain-containing protein n=1 Tax=Paenibacillus profundus TaxID=1173085 RepID=A0ABS8YNN4_9BACL|nr:hypothetical protein [Paenibacillus profundus]MCE5171204.1 hypothetical protein [Paenibacillus profundus]